MKVKKKYSADYIMDENMDFFFCQVSIKIKRKTKLGQKT